ncbi:hypothetical protein T492DRAFT_971814 [Pavlovales sp. CCMP2436]|nr:hypothetical protein T492DRAFT_971814 [Pavlovales sp. CCMP2436]|mmetsp:Transcript_32595/g.80891  ORF Transcript_32595/g.80891 Transcript_32595/m.80891 type:complete len:221 (-) Transcript_32595:147-809(-)
MGVRTLIFAALLPLAGAYSHVCPFIARTSAPRAVVTHARPIVACAPPADVVAPALETEIGFDHQPLADALKQGDLLEADRITRETLIGLAGEQSVMRGFVYFNEARKLPYKDLATVDKLWRAYTGDKQGYSVQSKIFRTPKVAKDLIKLYTRIGWSKPSGSLLRWTSSSDGNEFIYNNEEAPAGHLPLTSTLRGTRLLIELMEHPAIIEASQTITGNAAK